MSHSLVSVYVHLIFAVKHRMPLLMPDIRSDLFNFMAVTLRSCSSVPIEINGSVEHVHALFRLGRNHSIAKTVEELKRTSSRWLKSASSEYASFYWQTGYGIFSVSYSQLGVAKRYIQNQLIHHQTLSFLEERQIFLTKHGFSPRDWEVD